MARTEAQKRADAKYAKTHVKQIKTAFFPKDYDLYEWMKSKGYAGAWLRGLARREMEREKNSL